MFIAHPIPCFIVSLEAFGLLDIPSSLRIHLIENMFSIELSLFAFLFVAKTRSIPLPSVTLAPHLGWFKLNRDGSSYGNPGASRAGFYRV